ncbi:MAG: hypothetical protein ACXVCE_14370, partial [Bacteriovorax sp.]
MGSIFLLLSILLMLVSCSTELKYEMSNHKFLTPETKGEFLKGDVALSFQEKQKVVLATAYDNFIFNLPSTTNTNSSMTYTGEFNLPITLGLLNRLDFFTLDSKYGMKFQFLGSPENEKKIEWKAALALAYGSEHNDSSVTYSSNGSNRTYSTDVKVKNYDVNLIFGKRLTDTFLLYLSLMRDYYAYDGTLSSSQFSAVQVSGRSVNYGALLGGYLTEAHSNHPTFVKFEGGVVDGKLDNRNSRTAATFGGDVGWS